MNPTRRLADLGVMFRGMKGVRLPTGNRSLSVEAQAELILRARQKRERRAKKSLVESTENA